MTLPTAIAKSIEAFVGPAAMLLYPIYASVQAIESPSTVDDQQWLTYWILYSLITLFEMAFRTVLYWFPFWSYLKLLFILWLVLPAFNGAAYIYDNIMRKCINGGKEPASGQDGMKKVLHMLSYDTRKLVECYIDKYGPDSFEKIVKAAGREARKQKGDQARTS